MTRWARNCPTSSTANASSLRRRKKRRMKSPSPSMCWAPATSLSRNNYEIIFQFAGWRYGGVRRLRPLVRWRIGFSKIMITHCKKWFDVRGFGFLAGGSKDIFAHKDDLVGSKGNDPFPRLLPGARVECEV